MSHCLRFSKDKEAASLENEKPRAKHVLGEHKRKEK
jgi:hypothetical protein